MGRPKGSRSQGYQQRREELARRVFDTIVEDGSTSLRAMAERTDVSRPTLRHYFGSREGAVQAALESAAALGHPLEEQLANLPLHTAERTLHEALDTVVEGWRGSGLGNIHRVGLKVGLEDAKTAQTYLADVLEPLLQAMERLLDRLVEADLLAPHDARQGALALLSPVVMALLHQDGLGGAQVRPLVIDSTSRCIVDAWCRAHAPARPDERSASK